MLGSIPPIILLDVAILFTALSWCVGLGIAARKLYILTSLAIGCFVCLLGYSVQSLGAPGWAVIAAPVILDTFILWYILKKPVKMALAYIIIWITYTVFHLMLSAIFHFDSLIPVWKLHS